MKDDESSKDLFQFVIIGIEGSGKSTLVRQLKLAGKGSSSSVITRSTPTMGMDVIIESSEDVPLKEHRADAQQPVSAKEEYFEAFQRLSVLERVRMLEERRKRRRRK